MKIEFDEKELEVTSELPAHNPGDPATQLYRFPVTPHDNIAALAAGTPIWEPGGYEYHYFCPQCIPDNIARAFVIEARAKAKDDCGGKDMFGIEWEYIPIARGSMVQPGHPALADANDWREKITFPDIEGWDWESAGKANADYLDPVYFNMPWLFTGWFERLISFMDFEGAALALIDDDQKDAVKELFDNLSDTYNAIIDKFVATFDHIDGFLIHDDWGSQRAPFFSPDVCAEMIVPAMRKVTDHLHELGLWAELHCCGSNELQAPNMISAGWDAWSGQPMNDTQKLYDLYGDQIVIGVIPDTPPLDASDDEQRAAAKVFVDRFCRPEKPSALNTNFFFGASSPVFREEIYKQSRIAYGK